MADFRLLLAACAFLAPAPSRGVIIGHFKSLDDLIERSAVVVVVRVEKNIDPNEGPDLGSTHDCHVVAGLKGAPKAGDLLRLRLVDTAGSGFSPWRVGSQHLLFLVKNDAGGRWSHRSLGIQGSNLPASPDFRAASLKGLGTKEAARAVIKEYAEWRERQWKKEKEMLDKVLGGK